MLFHNYTEFFPKSKLYVLQMTGKNVYAATKNVQSREIWKINPEKPLSNLEKRDIVLPHGQMQTDKEGIMSNEHFQEAC